MEHTARGIRRDVLAELTERLHNDDEDVLRDVLKQLGARSAYLLRTRLGTLLSDADCDDALAVALFHLWQRRKLFDGRRSRLDQWFYLLARNAAIDILRRRQRGVPELSESDTGPLDHMPARADPPGSPKTGAQRDLETVLNTLPEQDRLILLAGLNDTELGEQLGISLSAVRQRRFRLKARVAASLRRMGHGTVS
jgi:RNA polymerase sigma factor (sigma-70 family)